MKTAIDGSGPIVIPKAIRDRLELSPEVPLDITIRDGAIVIEPEPTPRAITGLHRTMLSNPLQHSVEQTVSSSWKGSCVSTATPAAPAMRPRDPNGKRLDLIATARSLRRS